MKVSRLFQPRNPIFWLMLVLNALSPALAWLVHNRPLSALGVLLVNGFAIGNALIGTWLAWRLMRDEPGATTADSADPEIGRRASGHDRCINRLPARVVCDPGVVEVDGNALQRQGAATGLPDAKPVRSTRGSGASVLMRAL